MPAIDPPRCFFCGRPDATYCEICKAYLCPDCRANYPLRVVHAAAHPLDTAKKLVDFLAGR